MKLDRTCITGHSSNLIEHADMWSVSNNSPSSDNGDASIPNFQNIVLQNTVPTLYKMFYIVFCIIFTNLEKIFNNLPITASMNTKLKKFWFIIAIEISYIIWTQLEINNWIKFNHLFFPKGHKKDFYQKNWKTCFLRYIKMSSSFPWIVPRRVILNMSIPAGHSIRLGSTSLE